jgi:DNA-binding CsgD family transcriptional regulator/tetratricopeptide (TPR) repeat protein
VGGTSVGPDGSELLERAGELAVLTDAVEDAAQRRGSIVLIGGEPGIGKSTLLRTWLGDPDLPARALVGWCDDLLTSRTHGPFRDVARTTGGALAEAIASSDTPGVMEALHELLSDPLRPTALVLEDVHWADEATLDVVRFLGRRVARLPAILVLTYRRDELEPDHPLHRVLGGFPSGTVRRVEPRPLSTRAITELLAGTGLDVDEVLALTGGNPFYVTELAHHPGDRLPASVADAVVGRLHRLPPRTQQAVGLVAVQPRAVPLPRAIDLLGSITDLAAAESHGLVTIAEGVVGFRHELLRRAVLESLPAAIRIGHHETTLDHLLAEAEHGTTHGDESAAILHHAVEAGRGEVVARIGPAVARAAFDAGAHLQAVAHQEHVLRYEELVDAEELAWLFVERSWSLYNLHRFEEAVTAAERSIAAYEALGDRQMRCRMHLTRCRMLYIANRVGEAFEALAEAEALLPGSEPYVRAEYLANRAALLHLTDRYEEVVESAEAALAAARAVDRADLVAHVENYAGCAAAMLGDLDAGIERVRRARRIAEGGGWIEATARAHTNLVELLVQARRWDEADVAIAEALTHYERHDFRAHRYNTLGQRAFIAILQGDWRTAERILVEVEVPVRGAGVLGAIWATARAMIAVRTGAEDAEDALAVAWEPALTSGSGQHIVPVAIAAIERAWMLDRPEDADPFIAPALQVSRGWWRELLLWRLRLVREYPVEESVRLEPERTSLAGDWRAAAAQWRQLRLPFELGIELVHSGDEEAMREALVVFDGLGAEPAARLARRRLRDAGVHHLPRRPRASTREHPAGLTERQAEVLALLAEGLTNAQIAARLVVSVRTVDHHVAAVLQKLRVGTRQEAAAFATASGEAPSARS